MTTNAVPADQQDNAARLLQLFLAQGNLTELNAIGTVTTTGGTSLPDPTVAAYNKATLSVAGAPFVLPAASQGKKARLELVQDSTGSRTATFSVVTGGGALHWVGATAPTLTTTGGRSDILEFECYDGTNWVGSTKLDVTAGE